jgi:hypothetical protein
MLLICLPYIVSAQWQIGGNSGLSENRNALGTTDNVSVKFITNDIVRMRLMPNGNFGIGTDEPQRLLHVNGAIRFQNLNIGTQTTALMIDANGDLSLRALNNVAFSGSYNDLINKPTLFDGNWSSLQGTAPAISSFTNDVGYITNADDADADPTNELQDLSLNEDFLSISGGSGVSLKGINYWSKLGDNLYYNSGKVGIGTDEPNKLLHLHSEDVFDLSEPIPSGDFALSNISEITQMPKKNLISKLASSESALLLTNKNSGRTSADGLLIRSTNNNATISLQEEGELSITTKNSLRFKIQQNGNVSIGTPMTNFFTVKKNGNVGIGTSDPVAKLHIKDDKIIVERNQKYIHINASNPDAEIGSSTGQIKFWYTNGVGYNDLYCKNLYCKDLYSNGNVGIGTNEPMFKLDVRGTGHFCEVRVRTESWCDFVFADNYELPNLVELEKFIKCNRHLPGVPSEAEVIENGVDLGEMNRVLLQKIEELTLIIIEQDKVLNEQNERINKLELQQNN